MRRAIKIAAVFAGALLTATALAGCATDSVKAETSTAPAAAPSEPTPTPTPLTELPAWAKGTTWIVYPVGFKCWGTEGCPNDYRATFGPPGKVLPAGVVLYDPAVETWVRPADK